MGDVLHLCERLKRIPVAVMCDVLAAMGLRNQALASTIRPLTGAPRIAGPALCLLGRGGPAPKPPTGQSAPVFEMDRRITRGCVVVIDSGGHKVGALIGGNVAISWRLRGCVGIVTDGALRDVDEFAEIGLPTFATFATPLSTKGLWAFSDLEVPISLPGQLEHVVPIAPRDLIHADRDGVLVIPMRTAEQAVQNAEIFEALEKQIQRELREGEDREAVYARHDRLGHIQALK